ncbi:hypothetical protein JL722_14528 [Aureococcus anophagefferens]|nr:hypothetical protein JL722_14528 [Aureococcus anophagefferens]
MVSLTLNGSYQVPIRYVYNADAARTEGRSVHVCGTLYTDHLDEVMGCDAAYARYADWHVGIETEATLDYSAARLCANGVGFKNGGTTNLTQLNLTTTAGPFNWTAADANITNAILGSNWCRGTNGLGVEFRGTYDFDFSRATRSASWTTARRRATRGPGVRPGRREPDGVVPLRLRRGLRRLRRAATTAGDGDGAAVAGTDDVADGGGVARRRTTSPTRRAAASSRRRTTSPTRRAAASSRRRTTSRTRPAATRRRRLVGGDSSGGDSPP